MNRFAKFLRAARVAAVLFFGSVAASWAEPTLMSAPEAAMRVTAGEIVLLDIRSREEWAESGVAEGAWPVSMHEDDFAQRLQAILQRYDPSQIGLICATGGRSNYVAQVLQQNGVAGVVNVSEGMFGNTHGAGWIARGLPVVSAEDARAFYEATQAAWADE